MNAALILQLLSNAFAAGAAIEQFIARRDRAQTMVEEGREPT